MIKLQIEFALQNILFTTKCTLHYHVMWQCLVGQHHPGTHYGAAASVESGTPQVAPPPLPQ